MKKLLLTSLAVGFLFSLSNAQRFVLFEEFTGENCAPCASTNPGLEALANTGDNPTKFIVIKYQVPIPSAGPIYLANKTEADNRRSYYGVSSAPNARMDGETSNFGSSTYEGHPALLTQANINTQASLSAPFNITITGVSISATGGVSATVNVSATSTATYTNLKLRAALVETLDYDVAPGTNGEKFFPNVVREMYPDPNGQSIPNSWTTGTSSSYTISGTVPSIVDLNNEHFLVVWIQDDGSKKVMQAARTFPSLDIESESISTDMYTLRCGVPSTVSPKITLRNRGENTITSAKIYYKMDGDPTWLVKNWTGSLAKLATTSVTLDPMVISKSGFVNIIDSVAEPNGSADAFAVNNVTSGSVSVVDKTSKGLPYSSDLESADNGFVPYLSSSSGYPLFRYEVTGKGYDGSNGFLLYNNYNLSNGVFGYSILPYSDLPAGQKALDFAVAHAQYLYSGSGYGNDKLEVVYSEDCGATWKSIWSKSGSKLSTVSPMTGLFLPSTNAQWRMESIDISGIPNGAIIAFKATSGNGNTLLIDNVVLRTGLGMDDLVTSNDFKVYPNPVKSELIINIEAKQSFDAAIQITNLVGQVQLETTKAVTTGQNEIKLLTENLASGAYFVTISSNNGTITKKFVKQ